MWAISMFGILYVGVLVLLLLSWYLKKKGEELEYLPVQCQLAFSVGMLCLCRLRVLSSVHMSAWIVGVVCRCHLHVDLILLNLGRLLVYGCSLQLASPWLGVSIYLIRQLLLINFRCRLLCWCVTLLGSTLQISLRACLQGL
jgi:hypothetical protein